MVETPQWHVYDAALESTADHADPFWGVGVRVQFTAPSGRTRSVDAFWDGARKWRVRFEPDETGEWTWTSQSTIPGDSGLHGQRGEFRCVAYTGSNLLYQRGPIGLARNRRHFEHRDGSPFFWLGDTAWNGVLRSKGQDWDHYLATRRDQGFTAIQFVSTQWRGCTQDRFGETAFEGTERIRLSRQFFHRLDPRVAAINAHGLVAAPVLLWAFSDSDPGQALTEATAMRLVRYLVARWGAYSVIWLLGGDGDYSGERADRWRRIGNTVFMGRHDRLVTMHPRGQQWVGEEFRGEPWFDFIGYQSGHGDSPDHLRWLTTGPPANDWRTEPALPVVNLEPNYETHPAYHSGTPFTEREVRRAAYWSLLVSPTAGLTYGSNPIWVWPEQPEVPEGHASIGTVAPWRDGLDTPGVRSMTLLRRFFDSVHWWRLRPTPELLLEQPGEQDPRRFVAAAASDDGRQAVVYTPQRGVLQLRAEMLPEHALAQWCNPRTGAWHAAEGTLDGPWIISTPDADDWVLAVSAA